MQNVIGPVMLDLLGTELTQEEQEILKHPLVGGVIYFARNYESPKQIAHLSQAIRTICTKPILLAVDQEGGRVQRFKESFTRLPSMGTIGHYYSESPSDALTMAQTVGWLMAAEILSVGIDLSFAPVLDLNKEYNTVIADRSFGREPKRVIALATAFINGMNQAGMAATGKHFPGHGSVKLDSHVAMPVDLRSLDEITADDMQPFIELIKTHIAAMMPAHIVYPEVDANAVGFSDYWLKHILRNQYQYKGVIFSDDLNMEGAGVAGDYVMRSTAALNAGCDMILICNNRSAAISILDRLPRQYFLSLEKYQGLQGRFSYTNTELQRSSEWQAKSDVLKQWIMMNHPVI